MCLRYHCTGKAVLFPVTMTSHVTVPLKGCLIDIYAYSLNMYIYSFGSMVTSSRTIRAWRVRKRVRRTKTVQKTKKARKTKSPENCKSQEDDQEPRAQSPTRAWKPGRLKKEKIELYPFKDLLIPSSRMRRKKKERH
jgi:hypothetical protein